jgi:hypothetical protein
MEFKVGQKVKVVSLNGRNTQFYLSVGYVGKITEVHGSTVELDNDYCVEKIDIKLAEKDINDLSTLEVGDVVVDSDGSERTILAVCGRLVALSYTRGQDAISDWYTDKELAEHFKLKEEKTETIEIEGKKYTASEIKEALKKAGK